MHVKNFYKSITEVLLLTKQKQSKANQINKLRYTRTVARYKHAEQKVRYKLASIKVRYKLASQKLRYNLASLKLRYKHVSQKYLRALQIYRMYKQMKNTQRKFNIFACKEIQKGNS